MFCDKKRRRKLLAEPTESVVWSRVKAGFLFYFSKHPCKIGVRVIQGGGLYAYKYGKYNIAMIACCNFVDFGRREAICFATGPVQKRLTPSLTPLTH